MKKGFLVFTLALIVTLIINCLVLLKPEKHAIKDKELENKGEYFIVKVQRSTAALWSVVGDEKRLYYEPIDAIFVGNYPSGYNYDVEVGDNTFICYGEFIKESEFGGYRNSIYEIYDWDILYPVKRNSPFNLLLPKSYLCKIDMN